MKVSVLASGSKGNSTFIDFFSFIALVDVGISFKNINKKIESLNYIGEKIDYVFLTHIHDDHVLGLKQTLKKTNCKVILTKKMHEDIKEILPLERTIYIEDELMIKDVKITALKGSHDSGEVVFYIFERKGIEIAYVTDTGYINVNNFSKLKNKDLYLFESNHDIELLMNGKYPHYLKQRVISDEGHLSNDMASKYLCDFIGEKTKYIILFHLSENNNTPDLALSTLKKGLLKNNKKVEKIMVSTYEECTELVEL